MFNIHGTFRIMDRHELHRTIIETIRHGKCVVMTFNPQMTGTLSGPYDDTSCLAFGINVPAKWIKHSDLALHAKLSFNSRFHEVRIPWHAIKTWWVC